MNKVHPSRVDTWLGIVLCAMPIALSIAVWTLIQKPVPGKWFMAVAILLIGVLLPISLLLFTRYTITDKFLLIRSGIFSWKIPLNEISAIHPSVDPHASPALSLDRLRVEYGHGKSVLISPVRREEFLDVLRALGVPIG